MNDVELGRLRTDDGHGRAGMNTRSNNDRALGDRWRFYEATTAAGVATAGVTVRHQDTARVTAMGRHRRHRRASIVNALFLFFFFLLLLRFCHVPLSAGRVARVPTASRRRETVTAIWTSHCQHSGSRYIWNWFTTIGITRLR